MYSKREILQKRIQMLQVFQEMHHGKLPTCRNARELLRTSHRNFKNLLGRFSQITGIPVTSDQTTSISHMHHTMYLYR